MKVSATIMPGILLAMVLVVTSACQSRAISTVTAEKTTPPPVSGLKPASSSTPSRSERNAQTSAASPEPAPSSHPTLSPTPPPVPTRARPVATAPPGPTQPPPPTAKDEAIQTRPAQDTFPYHVLDEFNLGKLSGVVFHPRRQTLFAVTDTGHIIEIAPEGTLVQKAAVRAGADFEGITCDPDTGLLYVAVEGDEVILEVHPEDLQAARSIPIDRKFDGRVLLAPSGDGVEGIAYVPPASGDAGGTFLLANQSKELAGRDPSIVFEVEVVDSANGPQARIMRYFSLGVTDLSGLHYDPARGELLVISDDNDLLMGVNLSGQELFRYALPGTRQEGIALDGAGYLYIAQDSEEGLLKLKPNAP